MLQIARLLKYYRENCDLSQQQVAQVLNIDRSTYTYYETGKTVPSINTLMKLSRVFHVPYTVFFDSIDQEIFSDAAFADADSENIVDIIQKQTNDEKIYELSKLEQDMLIYFRLLETEDQEELLKKMQDENEKED